MNQINLSKKVHNKMSNGIFSQNHHVGTLESVKMTYHRNIVHLPYIFIYQISSVVKYF